MLASPTNTKHQTQSLQALQRDRNRVDLFLITGIHVDLISRGAFALFTSVAGNDERCIMGDVVNTAKCGICFYYSGYLVY